jgi:starvation-inducible outer membrane lipoprotein
MLKNSKHIKSSLIFAFALQLSSCIEKDTIFEINDLTKQQHFTYITQTNRSEIDKVVTIEGSIDGCVEIAYFYLDQDTSYIQ